MIQAESSQIEVSHEKTRFSIKKRAFQELRRVVHDDAMLKFLQTSSFYFIALHMMELQKKVSFGKSAFFPSRSLCFGYLGEVTYIEAKNPTHFN